MIHLGLRTATQPRSICAAHCLLACVRPPGTVESHEFLLQVKQQRLVESTGEVPFQKRDLDEPQPLGKTLGRYSPHLSFIEV